MGLWPSVIMTPVHVHGARSEREYEAIQRRLISQGRMAFPSLNWRDPWESADTTGVFIAGGKWLIRCECRNAPSVHPEWKTARCMECGAVYRDIEMPANASEIEAVLVVRPHPANRAWLWPESVEDLRAENIAHGLEKPVGVL